MAARVGSRAGIWGFHRLRGEHHRHHHAPVVHETPLLRHSNYHRWFRFWWSHLLSCYSCHDSQDWASVGSTCTGRHLFHCVSYLLLVPEGTQERRQTRVQHFSDQPLQEGRLCSPYLVGCVFPARVRHSRLFYCGLLFVYGLQLNPGVHCCVYHEL